MCHLHLHLGIKQTLLSNVTDNSSFTQPHRSQPCRLTASPSGAAGVRCLAQGHLGPWIKLATFQVHVNPLGPLSPAIPSFISGVLQSGPRGILLKIQTPCSLDVQECEQGATSACSLLMVWWSDTRHRDRKYIDSAAGNDKAHVRIQSILEDVLWWVGIVPSGFVVAKQLQSSTL